MTYESYNFGTLNLIHHYYTLSLFDLCLAVEKKNVKEIMQFNYMTCLLYTSDAADDMQCVDLGGRRIIKKVIGGLACSFWVL